VTVRTACLTLLLALAAVSPAGAAPERSLDIQQFHADVLVRRDGSIVVTERIRVHFSGSWNGIYRSIPVEYRTDQGLNYTLRVNIEYATDAAGQPLKWEEERDGRYRRVRIYVPNATDATREVLLTYEVRNGLRFFDEHDELYWNVTGAEWEFPIRRASAQILLPAEVEGVRTATFTGAYGSTEAGARAEQIGNAIHVRAARPLGFREGLTVVVGWNRGVIERPTTLQKAAALFASNAVLGAPLVAFFAMFVLWRRFGRDPDPGSIFVRYEPPAEMTPAEAGTLIDDRPDVRDITATLVDLAVRGFLVIEEASKSQLFGLMNTRDYELTLLQAEQWPGLKPHERALLQALSGHASRGRVRLSDLHNEFYKHLPEIRTHLNRTLVEGGYYIRRPDHVRTTYAVIGAAVAVALGLLGQALSSAFGISGTAAIVAAVLTFLVIAGFGWLMPARTLSGARAHAWVCGFQEFLGRVERDRLERLIDSPAAFERYLPYAMAFGVEKNWARAFDGLASEPPSWYRSRNGDRFRPNLFVADLGRMTSAAGSAMSSSPRSSSSGSSGFGGGGFSGGGFGGGGGGGF
jgi:uncharacterized membrane protein